MIRHRPVPERRVGNQVVVSRPKDGTALILGPTAALIWEVLEGWTAVEVIEQVLGDRHPEVAAEERAGTLDQVLNMLLDEGLIERHLA